MTSPADSIDSPSPGAPTRQLSLFDSTSIIVGIIIGTGIYGTAPTVASSSPHATGVLMYWIIGGILSLAGALCYAEMASAYPEEGADYVYLNRAFGPFAGYQFAWGQMVVGRPGTIAPMALVFASYAEPLLWPDTASKLGTSNTQVALAVGATVVLTGLNILGVRGGTWTQNLLTVIKSLGLLAILAVACVSPGPPAEAPAATLAWNPNLAMILVLFTFGGWSEMAFVSAEVRNPEKNLTRALVLGTTAVTLLYVLVNAAFLYALGHAGMANSKEVAIDTVETVFPGIAARAIGALVCISALGAANGLIFTGARIPYALGQEHSAFRKLGTWSTRFGTPVWALLFQGGLSISVILIFREFLQTLFYTTAVIWSFYLATGVALFVLRAKAPDQPRPYRVTGYPFTPIIFCASCVFLIYSAITFSPPWAEQAGLKGTAFGVLALVAGWPFYWLSRRNVAKS